MGHWGNDPLSFKMVDLYIETLQGTTFELRVSPLDTISDVKARIYKHEGIPISQQHLLFNSLELDDDYSLQDYDIQDGNTIKLIPQMRVGPINTRRIHIEEPSLRDYADYFTEANQEELYDKVSSNARPLTVIVYQNGDQINLYRIVDRDATSPLSGSLSNASMYGMADEEEEENPEAVKEKQEETDKLREKMKLLKLKMDAQNMEKKPKPKKLPRPPSSGRTSAKSRLRRVPSSAANRKVFNKNSCLPPVGFNPNAPLKNSPSSSSVTGSNSISINGATASLVEKDRISSLNNSQTENEENIRSSKDGGEETDGIAPLASSQTSTDLMGLPTTESGSTSVTNSLPGSARKNKMESDSAKLFRLSSVKEDEPVADTTSNSNESPPNAPAALEAILKKAHVTANKTPRKWEISQEVLLKDGPKPPTSPKKELATTSYSYKDPGTGRISRSSKVAYERFSSDPADSRPTTSTTLEALNSSFGRPATSSKRSAVGSKGGVILESLNESEVRAMSGMLSSYVRSSSRSSRNGFSKDGRIPTPESRLVSARFRLSANRDGHVTPHNRHLPPVKQKKKSVKRCFLCNKKTGLASSYICRCGYNFCAIHRYAESHDCTFDYKTEGRKLLEQSNPVVTAPKLPKI